MWPFTRKKDANADPELGRRLRALEARTADLAEDFVAEQVKAERFRARVYAVLGKRGVKLAQEDEAEGRQIDLSDPKLTKAQIKQALGLHTPGGQAARMKSPG